MTPRRSAPWWLFVLELAGVVMPGAALSLWLKWQWRQLSSRQKQTNKQKQKTTPPGHQEITLYPKSLTRMEKISEWNPELPEIPPSPLSTYGHSLSLGILLHPVNQPLPCKGIWGKVFCQVPTESLWHSRTWARFLCRLRKPENNKDYRETVYLSLQGLVLHLWNLRFNYYNEVLL